MTWNTCPPLNKNEFVDGVLAAGQFFQVGTVDCGVTDPGGFINSCSVTASVDTSAGTVEDNATWSFNVLPVPVASRPARRRPPGIAMCRRLSLALLLSLVFLLPRAWADGAAIGPASPHSVARLWNEQLLAAIRGDIPRPPAHARNLFHLSVAMWDAWAAYDPIATGYLVDEKREPAGANVQAHRAEAISYAAYRLLKYRFPAGFVDGAGQPCHPNSDASQAAFDAQMDALGYDRAFTFQDGDSAAALGNRIAARVIAYGQADGSNEGAGICYPDSTGYVPVNPPLIFKLPGVGELADPNRWQPLASDFLVTQNGIPLGKAVQAFVGVGWGGVKGFALGPEDANPFNPYTSLPLDPGPPPRLTGAVNPGDAVVRQAMVDLIRLSADNDPARNVLVDISPGAAMNNPRAPITAPDIR